MEIDGARVRNLLINDFHLFSKVFINIHETANYAHTIICIFDHVIDCVNLTCD